MEYKNILKRFEEGKNYVFNMYAYMFNSENYSCPEWAYRIHRLPVSVVGKIRGECLGYMVNPKWCEEGGMGLGCCGELKLDPKQEEGGGNLLYGNVRYSFNILTKILPKKYEAISTDKDCLEKIKKIIQSHVSDINKDIAVLFKENPVLNDRYFCDFDEGGTKDVGNK